ncbi:hypothetical protein ATANTOWER_018628 [Ataeniobius toweri]|uniref:Uncharacterized protein n=1 Tax=Ataeniobius toweri TaxID=208326 RepID=A0ABU7APX8_9TELE|nr:hypothetical protein [Ataeniobius toweri]
MCVCVVAGGVVGDAVPGCLPLADDFLPGEFVPSWCGVRGSVVGVVLGGVCPVAPVGGGWRSVARGPCLAVATLHQMWGLFPPCHTTCQWLVSLPTGVLVVLSVLGWVLWWMPAHSLWLLARAWTPGLCRASTWGVICLWVHGWICPGVDSCLCSGGPLDVYGSDLLRICPRFRGTGLWLLTLTIAYLHGETLLNKHAHTQTHRCLDSGVNRYTNVLY